MGEAFHDADWDIIHENYCGNGDDLIWSLWWQGQFEDNSAFATWTISHHNGVRWSHAELPANWVVFCCG